MTMYWGPWTTGTSNNCRVGIDLTVSDRTITARYYIQFQYVANDDMTLHMRGNITGDVNFRYNQSGGQMLFAPPRLSCLSFKQARRGA